MWEYNFAIVAVLFFVTALFLLMNISTRFAWVRIVGIACFFGAIASAVPLVAKVVGVPKSTTLEFTSPEKLHIVAFHLVPETDIYLWMLDPKSQNARPISYRYEWSDPMAKKLIEAAEEGGEGQNGQMAPVEFMRPFDATEDDQEPVMHPPPVMRAEDKANPGAGIVLGNNAESSSERSSGGGMSFGAPSSIYGGADTSP